MAAKATKAAAKKRPAKKTAKKAARKRAFGRPGTAGKAEGSAAVKAWMQGVATQHRPIVKKLDALIGEVVPDVIRAIKWSTPMYGRKGQGWFVSVAPFKNYVSLSFFMGTSLSPPPPSGDGKTMRHVAIRDMADYDEKQFRAWIEQAASIRGWGKA